MEIQRNNPLSFVLVSLAIIASSPARADQTSAQQDAQKVHDNGSNDSLSSSYGNALNALGNFYEMNLPGAYSNGMKAYGQYRNSQTMDNLRDENQRLAGSMVTAGGGGEGASSVTGSSAYVSPYARLDPKFLREGATGDVAAKIETLSGISREDMFRMAVAAQTSSKSLTDPDFIPWAMNAYKDFVAKMPNNDFRSGLESFGKLAEKGISTGVAQSVLAKFTGADGNPAAKLAQAEGAARTPAAQAVPVAEALPKKEESALDNSVGFTARGTVTTGVNANLRGLDRLGGEPVDGFLGDVLKRAGEDNSPTLFQIVSGKIKELNGRNHFESRRAMAQLPR